MRKNTSEHFWSNVIVGHPDECWEWKGKAGTGEYAATRWDGVPILCHRKAWELWNNKVMPKDLLACHKCDNPTCCNPNHIFAGTFQDNIDDRENKGRNKLPHSRGEDHGIHKLTEREVLEIIRLYYGEDGHTYYTLANKYKVSFGNIRKIVLGQTWSWLTGIKINCS